MSVVEAIDTRARDVRSLIVFNKEKGRYELENPAALQSLVWARLILLGEERTVGDIHYVVHVLDAVIESESTDDAQNALLRLPEMSFSDLLEWLDVATHSVEFVDAAMKEFGCGPSSPIRGLESLLRTGLEFYYEATFNDVMEKLKIWAIVEGDLEMGSDATRRTLS